LPFFLPLPFQWTIGRSINDCFGGQRQQGLLRRAVLMIPAMAAASTINLVGGIHEFSSGGGIDD